MAAGLALHAIALSTACSAVLAQTTARLVGGVYEKGLKFVDSTRYEEAIACFDRAIDLDPEQPEKPSSPGDFDSSLVVKNSQDAYRDLNRALAIDPADLWAYYVRGLVYEQANNYENAKADYASALVIQPDNADRPLAGDWHTARWAIRGGRSPIFAARATWGTATRATNLELLPTFPRKNVSSINRRRLASSPLQFPRPASGRQHLVSAGVGPLGLALGLDSFRPRAPAQAAYSSTRR